MCVSRDKLLKYTVEGKRAVVGRASKWQTKSHATKTAMVDEDDGDDAILVDRGMLIARTEEPIEDVTTTRRFWIMSHVKWVTRKLSTGPITSSYE